jgi:hypothetical protein
MKKIIEKRIGIIPSSETPSPDYLAAKLEEVEANEPQASQLDEVTSCDDTETLALTANLDISGRIQVVRKKSKINMPDGPEEFRTRLRVERNAWMFLAAKHVNRNWLHGMTLDTWEKYTDFFLGNKVYRIKILTSDASPFPLVVPWKIVLSFEWACRKDAFRLVRDQQKTLEVALQECIRDPELKELNFTTPLALGGPRTGAKRVPADAEHPIPEVKFQRKQKDKGKGKGRGKGKGQDKKGKGEGKLKLLFKTPDGREICYGYNDAKGCQREGCTRLHICRRQGCMGNHPMQEHPEAA